MPRFKVRDLMISVLPGAVEQQAGIPGDQRPQFAMDLCAVTHNPLDCSPGITSPLCGVGCTDCTNCTQCTGCTGCTACTGCTNCSQPCTFRCTQQCTGNCTYNCTFHCTGQCTGYCTYQCTGACSFQCTGYCSNSCTNPSAGQVPGQPNCGFSQFGSPFLNVSDPIFLSELKAQLRNQLAQVEAAELHVNEKLLPQTMADADMLEQKLTDALETLRAHKSELAARQPSKTGEPTPGASGGRKKTEKP